MKSKQSGFTLIEIAIVLVIIGLLLGGVMKGQELIESSRAKSAANDMNGIVAAYNGYIDRYRRLPGDDGDLAALIARGGNWATVTLAGNINGAIAAANADTFAATGETATFFAHLRAAGFLTGDHRLGAVVDALPTNAFGGRTSINNAASQGRPAARLSVCMSNVPGKAARALDVQLDDSASNGGTLRANLGGGATAPAAAAAAAYDEAQTYTICRDML